MILRPSPILMFLTNAHYVRASKFPAEIGIPLHFYDRGQVPEKTYYIHMNLKMTNSQVHSPLCA